MSAQTSNQFPELPDYQKAMKGFANGCAVGVFTGIVICLATHKAFMSLPLILGLIFGAIAFELKMKENGK